MNPKNLPNSRNTIKLAQSQFTDQPPTRYHLLEYTSKDSPERLTHSIRRFQHFKTKLNLEAYLPELDKLFSINLDQIDRLQLFHDHDHRPHLGFLYLLCFLDLTCVPLQKIGDTNKRQSRSAMKRATQTYKQFVTLATDILVQDPDLNLICDILNFYDFLLSTRFDTIPVSSSCLSQTSITDRIHPLTIDILENLCSTISDENCAVMLIHNQYLPVNIRADLVGIVDSYHAKKFLLNHSLHDAIFKAVVDRINDESLILSATSQISNTKMLDIISKLSHQSNLHAIAITSGYSSHVGSEVTYRLFDTDLLTNLVYESPYAKVRKLARKLLEYPSTDKKLLLNNRYIFPHGSIVVRNEAILPELMELIYQLIPVVDEEPKHFSHLRNFLLKVYDGSLLIELVRDLATMLAPASALAQGITKIVISKQSVDDIEFLKQQAIAPHNSRNIKLIAVDRLFKSDKEIFLDLVLSGKVPDKIYRCQRYFQFLTDDKIITQLLTEHVDKLSHSVIKDLSYYIVTPKLVAQLRLDSTLQSYVKHTNLGRGY